MKREFLKSIEGLTDEAIDKIMAENGKDIEAIKAKYADYEKLKEELQKAQETIAELEKAKGDIATLQKTIEEYKAAEKQREEEAKAAAARAELERRFDKVVGDRKFTHEYIRAGLLADFEKALADEANKGKGDAEIFEMMTKDQKGIFVSQNPTSIKMGGMGGHIPPEKAVFHFNFTGVRAKPN